MPSFLQPIVDAIQRAVLSPRDEVTRWQKAARWFYDFCRYGWRQLLEDDAPSMAAALSFRTLFGLLPVLVVITLVAKPMLGENLAGVVDWVVKLLGADGVQISGAADGVHGVPLSDFLKGLVAQASSLNLVGLGWIGGLLLLYAAISLMVTIENSFNRIVRAPTGRPWLKRIPLYWFVLTIGPIVLGLTPYLDARYTEAVSSISSWQWALQLAKLVWNVLLLWAFMFALYLWVPNTTMRVRPVLVGALVAAILLQIGKSFLGVYLNNAFATSMLSGSLGLLPLFMFWVYLMWMAVLFGLEVTAMVQYLHGRRMAELEKARPKGELVDPVSVLVVMQSAATRFALGQPSTVAQLADAAGISGGVAQAMTDRLVASGFLHRIDVPEDAVTLARPADAMNADALIKVGWELVDSAGRDGAATGFIASLREAQSRMAAGTTLAMIGR